ncbi:MAG TPA: M67 family metallopeptidase [Mycobacteriales bacterium]|nr:M67 family metallopeptidase [Mycobacteriales bacterium]
MLVLPREMVDAVVAHARRDHPDECCGVIAGRDGAATRVFAMANAERSPTGFAFDSAEQLRVWREIDDADEEVLVVYHSHTMTEAYPSRTDVRWSANTPGVSWLLVSTRDPDAVELRSFRIDGGVVAEEPLHVVDRAVEPG